MSAVIECFHLFSLSGSEGWMANAYDNVSNYKF